MAKQTSYSVRECADILNVHPTRINQLVNKGALVRVNEDGPLTRTRITGESLQREQDRRIAAHRAGTVRVAVSSPRPAVAEPVKPPLDRNSVILRLVEGYNAATERAARLEAQIGQLKSRVEELEKLLDEATAPAASSGVSADEVAALPRDLFPELV
jgi:hypothetical protein